MLRRSAGGIRTASWKNCEAPGHPSIKDVVKHSQAPQGPSARSTRTVDDAG